MKPRAARWVGACAGAILLCGCAAPLPTYPWVDHRTALTVLSERAKAVRTVSAWGTIVLGKAEGSAVHLDGALAAEIPGRLRVRAWKFGQAAFDLTVTPDGVWIMTGEDAPADAETSMEGLTSDRFAEGWGLFTGDFFAGADHHIKDDGGPMFAVSRPWGNGGDTVWCFVDRSTLTPLKYRIVDAGGRIHQTLELDRYRQIDGIPWPFQVTARGDSGFLILDMDEVELNTQMPAGAFKPPARAVKRP